MRVRRAADVSSKSASRLPSCAIGMQAPLAFASPCFLKSFWPLLENAEWRFTFPPIRKHVVGK